MTAKPKDLPKSTRKHLDAIAKDGIPEGWTLSASDAGYQIQRLDVPADHPTFEPENGTAFETDDAAIAHVIAKGWQGSQLHKNALLAIETFDPEEFSRMGVDDLRTASSVHARRERETFNTASAAVAERARSDETFSDLASEAFQELTAEIDARRKESADSRRKYKAEPIKQYEAHHENEVARMAFINALHETGDPSAAADHTRRRMLLTATPQEFLAPVLEELRAEATKEEEISPGL